MFTFKRQPRSGRFYFVFNDSYDIKDKGKIVGMISVKEEKFRGHKYYQASFIVKKKDINEDGNPNCVWKWLRLKKTTDDIETMKTWLKEKYDELYRQFDIHPLD